MTTRRGKAVSIKKAEKKRSRGKPFVKGDPRAGRPKGTLNKVTKDGREFWRMLMERPKFLGYLVRQFDRKNGPGVPLIQLASYYAFGKPVQAIDLGVTFDPGEHLARMYDKVVGPSK